MNISVLVLQRGLTAAGHSPGTLDGRWGPATFNAWASWFATVPESDPMSLDLADDAAAEGITDIGWRDFGPMGVRTIAMTDSMVAHLTALAEGRTPPRPIASPLTPTSSAESSGAPPLPPALFAAPTPDSPLDFDAMIARLASGTGTTAAPTNGGPVIPVARRRPRIRRAGAVPGEPWMYALGGVALLGVVGAGIWYYQKRR